MALSDIASNIIAWRKAEIQELLNGFNHKTVRRKMNEIISIEMNISSEEARNIKTIKQSIVKKILLAYE